MVGQKSHHLLTNWSLITSLPLIFSAIVITLNWTNINEHSTLTTFRLITKSSLECYFVNGAILYIFLIPKPNDWTKRRRCVFFSASPLRFFNGNITPESNYWNSANSTDPPPLITLAKTNRFRTRYYIQYIIMYHIIYHERQYNNNKRNFCFI